MPPCEAIRIIAFSILGDKGRIIALVNVDYRVNLKGFFLQVYKVTKHLQNKISEL